MTLTELFRNIQHIRFARLLDESIYFLIDTDNKEEIVWRFYGARPGELGALVKDLKKFDKTVTVKHLRELQNLLARIHTKRSRRSNRLLTIYNKSMRTQYESGLVRTDLYNNWAMKVWENRGKPRYHKRVISGARFGSPSIYTTYRTKRIVKRFIGVDVDTKDDGTCYIDMRVI